MSSSTAEVLNLKRTDVELFSLAMKGGPSLDKRVESLVDEMLNSLEKGNPVNLSVPKHNEITKALHRLVYMEGEPGKIAIKYNDGSRPRSISVRVLPAPPEPWEFEPRGVHIAIGTCSFRHLDYDNYVEMYLVRDTETRRLQQAEVDKLAYDKMKQLLDHLLAFPADRGEPHISIYQAGLEPLAVGMYRAIVENLIYRYENGLGSMKIRPVFFIDDMGNSEYGEVWGL